LKLRVFIVMSKRFQLTESEIQDIRKKYFFESESEDGKRFCHSGNVKTLEDIVGDDEASETQKKWVGRYHRQVGITQVNEITRQNF
jgi:hypothetical protein